MNVREFEDLWIWLVFDYAQIEIRILAEMSGCKRLIHVINSGSDIHADVGHDITGQPREVFQDKFNDKPRVMIKALHFSIIYGKKPPQLYLYLLAQGVKTTEEEVEEFYEKYFEKYPEVRDHIEERQAFADAHGYVTTMFGFRREIAKVSEDRTSFWANQAVNSGIQGTAHQLVLLAIAETKRKPKTFWALRKDMRMEVHDANYYRVKLKNLQDGYKQGKFLLEDQVKRAIIRRFGWELKVPLLAEAKTGFRQGSLVGYQGEPLDKIVKKWLIFNACVDDRTTEALRKIAG